VEPLQLIATTAFGLEAVVSRELEALGYRERSVSDGRVEFTGDAAAVARANLWLRSADRVLLKLSEFEATDFGELFDQVVELPWCEWLTEETSFPVRARCVRSQIHSEPDTQAITKKAVVEALKRRWPRDWFEETGAEVPIVVTIRRDRVTVALDTTGRGLHRRGYRILTGGAPLRETLAAALLQLSYWEPGRVLADPCCGTGTILIEAAWMAANRAPGLGRGFVAEEWPASNGASNGAWNGAWKGAREEAADLEIEPPDVPLLGGDINPKALKLARRNAGQARVETAIEFQQLAVADFGSHHKYGCVVTNPPYGERMGEQKEATAVYGDLGRLARRLETWSVYAMSAQKGFEKIFAEASGRGRQVRRRKLYNGPIECTYYQYAGPRPPWT